MIKLKGFPTEISDYIELPDIGELLLYPFFFDTDIEDAYKYGTEFQRKLIDTAPLRNTKSTISVLCEVRLLAPFYRSCTESLEDPDYEWHIDCEEKEDGPHIYTEETDIVHLLTNKVSSMTEFNKNEVIIENVDPDLPYMEFIKMIQRDLKGPNKLGIIPQKMPHNRIVTFTNHLHRATNPTGYELKFMFRIVETNRKRKPGRYNPNINASRINGPDRKQILNIMRLDDQIKIFIPKPYDGYPVTIEDDENYDYIKTGTVENGKLVSLDITDVGWELNLLGGPTTKNQSMKEFTPKNSIMLLGKGDFSDMRANEMLVDFFRNIDKVVKLVSDDGQEINAVLRKDFYDNDELLGKIYGIHVILNSQDVESMRYGVGYKIVPRNESTYKLNIPENLRIFRDDKFPG